MATNLLDNFWYIGLPEKMFCCCLNNPIIITVRHNISVTCFVFKNTVMAEKMYYREIFREIYLAKRELRDNV